MNLFTSDKLVWKQYREETDGYPVDYAEAILDARSDGRLEILVKWEPECYCHYHRHTAETSSLVIAGELHVTDIDPDTGEEKSSRIRPVGDFVHKEPGDVHMERGGPEGALVFFSIYAPEGDGKLAEALMRDGSIGSVATMEKILTRQRRSHGNVQDG